MATRTVTALFDSYEAAASAVRKVEAAGVPHADVSIVSNDEGHRQYYDDAGDDTGTDTGSGLGAGASLGTVLGGGAGLLAGLGMLAIPGLGPVVAAGWLASTLVGAGIGAAAGGLVGSLTGAGISHEDAHVYAEGVRRGGTLVTVRAEDGMIDRVVDVLDDEGTVNLDERQTTWRNDGWNGEYLDAGPTAVPPASEGFVPASTSTFVPGTTRTGEAGGLATRAVNAVEDGASRATAAVENAAHGLTEPSAPVTRYESTTTTTTTTEDGVRRVGSGRVRVYPAA